MGGFAFRLEHEDGTPAEPRRFEAAAPNWSPGDTIHLGREKMLRVIDVRDDDARSCRPGFKHRGAALPRGLARLPLDMGSPVPTTTCE
jgi:hypothetical protein